MHTHTYTHISKHMHSGVSVADFLHIDILATDSGTSFHPVPLQATDSERGRDNQSEPLKWRAKSIRYKFFKRHHYGQHDIEPFPIHPPPPLGVNWTGPAGRTPRGKLPRAFPTKPGRRGCCNRRKRVQVLWVFRISSWNRTARWGWTTRMLVLFFLFLNQDLKPVLSFRCWAISIFI